MAAGVNPSDVKASLGHMPHAIWPRIPGRDFAGIVREGPDNMIGMEIWGGGGELGITQNGRPSAKWLVLDQKAVRAKPSNMTMEEAGSVGVPFITAFEGLREAGGVQPTDVVLVCGGNGKVGQAVIQLATMAGATVLAVEHTPPLMGHTNGPVEMFDQSSQDVAQLVRERTGGHGADIVFNTVGSPYFEMANKALAKQGRRISSRPLNVRCPLTSSPLRGRHKFIGIDTLALSSVDGARIFDKLKPKFEAGLLKPFPINPDTCYGFDDAARAFASVLRGTPDRVLLRP